jgi:hypothetical protein
MLKAQIEEVHREHPAYGHRRVALRYVSRTLKQLPKKD